MEIVESVHQVEGVNGNVYLLIDGGGLTLVDTGFPNSTKDILGYIHKINQQPSNISRILLTHCHVDHVGSAQELKQLTKAKVGVHQEDADFVAGLKTLPRPKGASNTSFIPVQPDIVLKENDKVSNLTVVHTPGHTPGSIALYDPMRKILFVGDTLRFIKGEIIGPSEQFTSDMHQAMRSIEKISRLDFDVMLSGHGDPLKTNASDKVKEFYDSTR